MWKRVDLYQFSFFSCPDLSFVSVRQNERVYLAVESINMHGANTTTKILASYKAAVLKIGDVKVLGVTFNVDEEAAERRRH